jgi:hypothetical protein
VAESFNLNVEKSINVENNNEHENNNELENNKIEFNPDEVNKSFAGESEDDFFENEDDNLKEMVNDIDIFEPVLNLPENDNDEKDLFVENEGEQKSRISNNKEGNSFEAQDNEEAQEELQEYRPTARVLFDRAITPAEFKSEAIAVISDLLKDYNASEDLINEIYKHATEQCQDREEQARYVYHENARFYEALRENKRKSEVRMNLRFWSE